MRVRLNHEPAEDEGTIVLFPGQVWGGPLDGLSCRVAVDHRPARELAEQLTDPDTTVVVEAEKWQVFM